MEQKLKQTLESFKKLVTKDYRLTAIFTVVGLIALAPIITLLTLLIMHSVNVPWWDQMSFVTIMGKLHEGSLTFYDLWKQHNEHRIVVAQALELAVGSVTNFSFRVPVFLNLITALGSFALLVSLLARTFEAKKVVAVLAIPFAWLIFTPFQWVNWIWGFQLAFFLSVFFSILSIWLLTSKRLLTDQKIFIGTVVVAAITTYCNGNGLLVWPIGLAILLSRHVGRQKLYIWCGSAAVILASYFYKFHRAADSPHLSELIKAPLAVLKYMLTYLGRNLATTKTTALYVGLVLLIVCILAAVYIYHKRQLSVVTSWLAVAAYVLFTATLAAVSRLNQGVEHSFNSNSYPTFSLFFIVATIALVAYAVKLYLKDFKPKKMQQYVAVFFALGVLVALPVPAFAENYAKGVTNFEDLGNHLSKVEKCVYSAQSVDDPCLLIVYPHAPTAWEDVQILREMKWGGFRD
jgi:hypothetical protein